MRDDVEAIGGEHDLVVHGLDAWYGQAQALFGIDLHVDQREIVGVFGHNGAGKSTLLRAVARLHTSVRGSIRHQGEEIVKRRPDDVARRGVYLVREGSRVFETLTVDENVLLGARLARLSGRAPRTLDEVYDVFGLLADKRTSPAGFLSGGQRQALALAVGYASNPQCMLLDEPSTGLAPVIVDAVYETITRLAADGVAVLIAEQNPEWLADLSQRGYLLETGRVEAAGRPESFLHLAAS